MPKNTDFHIDFLTTTVAEFPSQWWDGWTSQGTFFPQQTFVLLAEDANVANLEQKLQDLMERYMGKEVRDTNTYFLQPLKRIHLYSTTDYGIPSASDITYISS